MLRYTVRADGTGTYGTIQEAIDGAAAALESLPDSERHTETVLIHIGPGTYHEKLFSELPRLLLEGEGEDRTVITWSDFGRDVYSDGTEPVDIQGQHAGTRGTFRSYTAFLGGAAVCVRDLTIRNEAGEGRDVGQAVALYADADICSFEHVTLTGCQDTLFCSPLPDAEREKGGFIGPRMNSERRLTRQHYVGCTIVGDVDFIFGGADVVFDDCDIISHRRAGAEESGVNGYITAPSGKRSGLGLVFRSCRIKGEDGVLPHSVYLGRPWRPEGKSSFLNCTCDESVAVERFSGWHIKEGPEEDATFTEYGTVSYAGQSLDLSRALPWVHIPDAAGAQELSRAADEVTAIVAAAVAGLSTGAGA